MRKWVLFARRLLGVGSADHARLYRVYAAHDGTGGCTLSICMWFDKFFGTGINRHGYDSEV